MKMKTAIVKKIITAALCFATAASILSALPASRVLAQQDVFMTLEEQSDITIIVRFDTERPQVKFISPDGKTYEKYEDFDQVLEADNATYYNIEDASAGDWTIDFEKGGNSEVTVDVVPWHKPIDATALTVTLENAEDKKLPYINGVLSVDYEGNFNYILSAVVVDKDGNVTNSIPIDDGFVFSDGSEDMEFSVYPDMLPDGTYMLSAEVYAEDDTGTEVRDVIVAGQAFTITGSTSEGDIEKLTVICNVGDSVADIYFDGEEFGSSCDEYAVIVKQGDELLDQMLFEEDTFHDHIIFDPQGGEILVQINAQVDEIGFVSWTLKFDPKMPVDVNITTPEKTADLNAVIEFDAHDKSLPGAIKIGDKSTSVMWSGKDKVQVGLENLEVNEIEIDVTDGQVTYTMNKRITADTIPPLIDIYGASGDMRTTEEKIVFAGATEAGAVLTVNGEKVELDKDGAFGLEKELQDGMNEFKFEATDDAGNTSVRLIRIFKGDSEDAEKEAAKKNRKINPVAAVIITVVFAFAAAFLAIFLKKRNIKKGRKELQVITVLRAFGITLIAFFTGLGIWQLILHYKEKGALSGSELIELLKSSTWTDIASKIQGSKDLIFSALISFGIALLILIIMIVARIIRKKIGGRGDKSGADKSGGPSA
ncbi:MAG: hypothetical protein IKN14_01400 [Clostridiales bacterium]|nr:hypothetical protein [Clostridiales bacterium]